MLQPRTSFPAHCILPAQPCLLSCLVAILVSPALVLPPSLCPPTGSKGRGYGQSCCGQEIRDLGKAGKLWGSWWPPRSGLLWVGFFFQSMPGWISSVSWFGKVKVFIHSINLLSTCSIFQALFWTLGAQQQTSQTRFCHVYPRASK